MKTLKFVVKIQAPAAKVWEVLWNDDTYRKWTTVFHEGSHAVSDWKEGSKILFLGPNGDGMFSIIEKKTDNMLMVFKHLGELKNGIETASDWGEARERYDLTEESGATELTVTLDSVEEFQDYFSDTFPKALDIIKQISEMK